MPVFQGRFLGLIYSPGKETKFSLIISAKIAKKAVARNRVRRLFYLTVSSILFPKPGWYLFLAKKNILEARPEDLEKELNNFKNKI